MEIIYNQNMYVNYNLQFDGYFNKFNNNIIAVFEKNRTGGYLNKPPITIYKN